MTGKQTMQPLEWTALRELVYDLRSAGQIVGAQIAVSVGSNTSHFLYGQSFPGKEMLADSKFRLYCAGKPVLAYLFAVMYDELAIDLDALIVDCLPEITSGGKQGITYRQLLNHSAGLHGESGVSFGLASDAARELAVRELAVPDGWTPGAMSGYSQYPAWHLLGKALERHAGMRVGDLMDRVRDTGDCLSHLDLCMSEARFAAIQSDLGVHYDCSVRPAMPFLMDRSRQLAMEWNPGYGAVGSAHGLMCLFRELLAALSGDSSAVQEDVADEFWGVGSGKRFDVVYERECNYCLGATFDLPLSWQCECCSDSAFGQSGMEGCVFGLADRARDLSAGVVINSFPPSSEEGFVRRRAIINAIYKDIGSI